MSPLAVGRFYSFDYPAANYEGVRVRLERRRVKVLEARDTFAQPLEFATLIEDPLLMRGRWLYRCLDLDKGEERKFYDRSMFSIREIAEPKYGGDVEPPQLMAVVDPGAQRVVARAMPPATAEGFARGWSRRHGMACTVIEPINLPSDDQVLEQLR
jgi:hypothetical protein